MVWGTNYRRRIVNLVSQVDEDVINEYLVRGKNNIILTLIGMFESVRVWALPCSWW